MIEKIYEFIKKYNMLEGTDNIVVGVSGGADSVCLLVVLCELAKIGKLVNEAGEPVKVTGIHVNHGIRGEEALRDQEFSERLCRDAGVDFIAKSVDVPFVAKERHLSEEEAGRILRYEIFEEEANMLGHCKIAVAHHMNDQAETVLMNMFRGSSFNGLTGMQPVRDRIIRPLLSVTRQEIEEFLSARGQGYITDSTNLSNDYTRNKMRNVVIPYIENNINVQTVHHISDAAASVSEVKSFVDRQAGKAFAECVRKVDNEFVVNINAFSEIDICIQREILRRIIERLANKLKDVYRVNIDNALKAMYLQVLKNVDVVLGIRGIREYDVVRFTIDEQDVSPIVEKQMLIPDNLQVGDEFSIEIGQNIYIPSDGLVYLESIHCKISDSLIKTTDNDYTKFFDYDKIPYKLLLRKRREGDTISLAGAQSKKMKKELTDRKIPLRYREACPMMASDNNVLWAVGLRRCDDYKISQNTGKILVMSLSIKQ